MLVDKFRGEKMNSKSKGIQPVTAFRRAAGEDTRHGGIVSIPEEGACLDSIQLNRLELEFRQWASNAQRENVRHARLRLLVTFLLIRYTGAKLSEILTLNPVEDIDFDGKAVLFRNSETQKEAKQRKIQISEVLSKEIQAVFAAPFFQSAGRSFFEIDPGFVRRKFYERAQACGFPKQLGGPEMIRKARGVELMRGNMPLPVVQRMFGHSSPNLTSSYVSFSTEDMERVTKLFMDREASRKTSARNSFFGKIRLIQRGDIQTQVTLTTISGNSVVTMITNGSLERLALTEGRLITAEVKAPWVMLHRGKEEPECSAENRFEGVVEHIQKGRVNTEYTVRMTDGTALCAICSTERARRLALVPGNPVWALFTCNAVVLNVD